VQPVVTVVAVAAHLTGQPIILVAALMMAVTAAVPALPIQNAAVAVAVTVPLVLTDVTVLAETVLLRLYLAHL
jgi:hypothetical protein